MTHARPVDSTRARAHPAVDRAVRDLDEAAVLVVGLAHLREPGIRRPWREPALHEERRAELDYAARAERAERTAEAIGEHPDACRADILDALSAVLTRAEDLAHHLSRAAWCPALPAAHADADPRPYLARAAACLPVAASGPGGAEVAGWAAGEAARIVAAMSAALALIVDGQQLRAVCPWCDGRTEMAPLGGERTWRVRMLPGNLVVIVCESGTCTPPAGSVTTWWRGRPAWAIGSWDWLAAQVERADAAAPVEGTAVPLARAHGWTGRAGTVVSADALRALLDGLVHGADNVTWPDEHGTMTL
ncbi:hypothetical protein E1264_18505 [Actinomadura sp. KC216]|uniref:hypothetical protein n=1 Tax=Actinomadura sp. KC216 TaxID=2530370 RepID=UPI00104576E4|nr:hypothetical protein [Actinomadura sp. KC216]TDB86285.1 hypothetical protein E1264_18505 [Actinomadura sp. KC216]